uniref:Uncharacterized protein n=1 Tax=Rousettus aegyptiacus TaxID=9407 RepID=A0A7J8JFP6_ROUAE|nr:hypothetical protein HJG63_010112 [Rousettus aegyptiacus]
MQLESSFRKQMIGLGGFISSHPEWHLAVFRGDYKRVRVTRHREELTAAPVPQRAAGVCVSWGGGGAEPPPCPALCLLLGVPASFIFFKAGRIKLNLHSPPDMSPAPVKPPQPFLQVRCHPETANIS